MGLGFIYPINAEMWAGLALLSYHTALGHTCRQGSVFVTRNTNFTLTLTLFTEEPQASALPWYRDRLWITAQSVTSQKRSWEIEGRVPQQGGGSAPMAGRSSRSLEPSEVTSRCWGCETPASSTHWQSLDPNSGPVAPQPRSTL